MRGKDSLGVAVEARSCEQRSYLEWQGCRGWVRPVHVRFVRAWSGSLGKVCHLQFMLVRAVVDALACRVGAELGWVRRGSHGASCEWQGDVLLGCLGFAR